MDEKKEQLTQQPAQYSIPVETEKKEGPHPGTEHPQETPIPTRPFTPPAAAPRAKGGTYTGTPQGGSYQSQAAPPRQRVRRVGTVTFGVTLIAAGFLFLFSLFFPGLDVGYFLRFTPIILILLGIEVLIYHFGFRDDRVKYDFLSFIFCFVMIFGSLGLCFALQGYDYVRARIWSNYQEAAQTFAPLGQGESIQLYQDEDGGLQIFKVESDGTQSLLFDSGDYIVRQDEEKEPEEDSQADSQKQLEDVEQRYQDEMEEIINSYEEKLETQKQEYEAQIEELTENSGEKVVAEE